MAYVPVELADPASIDEALAALDGEWDGVAHIAGIPGTAPDDKVIAVNFLGMRRFVTGIAGRIKRGGGLAIVASTARIGMVVAAGAERRPTRVAGVCRRLDVVRRERRGGLPGVLRVERGHGRLRQSSSPPTPGASTASGSTP